MKYVNTPYLNTFGISDFSSVFYIGSTMGRKVYDVIGVSVRLMVFFLFFGGVSLRVMEDICLEHVPEVICDEV